MTDTRLVSVEALAAALKASDQRDGVYEQTAGEEFYYQRLAEGIFAAIPAAPAEAGLREALAALISDAIGDNEGCPHHYGNLGYSCTCEIPVDAIRAALAAQEGAGE